MILFNVIPFYTMLKNYYKNSNHLIKLNQNKSYLKTSNSVNSDSNNKLSLLIVSSKKNLKNKLFSESFSWRINNNLIARNFWQKFINQYLQETVFLSQVNQVSDTYTNKLRTNGLSIYNANEYNNFLLKFSKDLLNGAVVVSSNKNNNALLLNNHSYKYVQYKWFKLPKINLYLFDVSKNSYLNSIKHYRHKVLYKSLPLFTLINDNKQVILSESPDQLFHDKTFYNLIFKFLSKFSYKKIHSKNMYIGLIFINPKDALEYRDYINSKHIRSTNNNNINLIISDLKFYYQLLSSSVKNTEFRLIPDLREVSDLLYNFRNYKNVFFDSKQKHGKNYFQGQPIYLIQSIIAKNKNTGEEERLSYEYNIKNSDNIKSYKTIFLNYQTAIDAWSKFREEHSNYSLPIKPKLFISNLELFIKTLDYGNNKQNFIFVPSLQSYEFAKKYIEIKSKDINSITKLIINESLYIRTIFKRVIWSLTSRQPINW
uniref:Ycf80 n=1 Tax=Cliftonaea pectinata TaxID=2007206 RepID=A0A1Z1MPY9_9FLOR|nr:hypothetical protein [Cliftonaea pectinata]ARW68006.1 hypothetical protein [Cliftonaea pectinata]